MEKWGTNDEIRHLEDCGSGKWNKERKPIISRAELPRGYRQAALQRQNWDEMDREKMLSGVKVCTSRSRPMGKPGDTFEVFGAEFELERVYEIPLKLVPPFWEQEGCTSPEHFIEVWNSIHPRKRYDPNTWVWFHWFRRIDD